MEAVDYKKKLLELTAPYIDRADLIQGPGGNTSIKSQAGHLYIKASGFRFEEMNLEAGISALSMDEIPEFFYRDLNGKIAESEAALLALVKRKILHQSNGEPYPKPSMETGFHILLDEVVVHTHSVWTNVLNCAENRLHLFEDLKNSLDYQFTCLPFLTPGFMLSYSVGLDIRKRKDSKTSDLFFLANHGIIAHGKSGVEVEEKLRATDLAIQQFLGISHHYPSTAIESRDEDMWLPVSDFVSEMIDLYHCQPEFFDRVLFPDQTVFFKDQMSNAKSHIKKINIINGRVFYHAGQREAKAIHETLSAYLFIYHQLSSLGLKPAYITPEDIEYINSMDMEKYRKSLM